MEYIEKYQNRLAKKQTKLLPMCPAWTITGKIIFYMI